MTMIARQSFKNVERSLTNGFSLTTTSIASARMSSIRQHGTTPELLVRDAARAVRLRLSIDNRDLPGSPDLANRSRRIAIFVHGCYWHRHEHCGRSTTPKSNTQFWLAKFARNIERDKLASQALGNLGYEVSIIWECEALKADSLTHQLAALATANPSRRRMNNVNR